MLQTQGENIATTNVTFFAISPVRPVTYRGGYVEFELAPDDFFEEVLASNAVVNLYLDADDGLGWMALQIGETTPVSYYETGQKTLFVAAELADGQMLFAAAPFEVAALSTPDPTTTIDLTTSYGLTGVVSNVKASLYVLKAAGNSAGYLPTLQTFSKSASRTFSGTAYSEYFSGLRSPVLVSEGFDMNNDMDWDVLYHMLNKQNLAETLNGLGRDLLVLDFSDATRDIFENAAVAALAVEYTTYNRANFTDSFTVIGASMGGLVTRIALTKIEENPYNFLFSTLNYANTWVSFDSPHTGANIPLGVQEFCDFFGYVATQTKGGVIYDSIYQKLVGPLEFKQQLNTPAARQMLISHQSTTAVPSGSHQSFYTALDSIGYPYFPKRIAICNGAGGNTRHPFQPGEQIVNWLYEDFFQVDIYARIYALPRAYATPSIVFYGRLNPFDLFFNSYDWITTINACYWYSIDNAPGGTRPSFFELYNQIPSAYKSGSQNYCRYDSHCFIPTVSALGMPLSLCEYAADAYKTWYSPFHESYTAPQNEPHIEINENNKEWFIKAVLEGADADGDGRDDWRWYSGTKTTPVPVPYEWLKAYGVNNDFETAAFADSDGDGYTTWQEYVIGSDPTNALSRFTIFYYGAGNLFWTPYLFDRVYTVIGKTNLSDSAWSSPLNEAHRFFKVRVDLP